MKIIAISVFISLLLFAAFSCKNNPIIPPSPNDELDSTSHNIVWQIDTIGTWQSVLWDVWGTDPNNVYAAGYIFTSNDGREGTNIMHWDGKQWNPEPFWEGEITAIYGFSKNDVWVAGAYIADPFFYPLFGHWNGSKWEKTVLSISGVIGALWGTSPTNLYAVGSGGMILHYDGSYWTQMNSGTNIRALSDIWGFSDNAIYASGYDASSGRGVLLYYNGTTWKTLIDKIYNYGDSTNSPAGQIPSVWGYDDSHLYIWTPPGTFFWNESKWTKLDVPTDNTYMEKIGGSSKANVFIVGDFSLIIHWNGKSWHRYDELYRKPYGDILYSTYVFQDQVFIVGRSETAKGIVYRGTIINN